MFADGEQSLSKKVRRRTDEAEHIAIQYEEEERQRTSISRRHIIQSGRRRWLLKAKERERERAAKADDDGKQKGRWTLRRRR